MLKRLGVLVSLLWLLATGAWAQFLIEDYRVDMKVNQDGVLNVEETIVARFTEPRRGIIRDIPWALDNGKGATRATFLHVKAVLADGQSSPYNETSSGGNLRIRIGEKETVFPAGTVKTYTIRYDVENAINWFEKASDWEPYAEVYWNAIGTEWTTTIAKATVSVRFAPQPERSIRVRAFSGGYGSRNDLALSGVGSKADGGMKLMVRTDGFTLEKPNGLALHEGVTFVLALPETAIAKPTPLQQARFTILPNLGYGLPILALALCWITYLKVGKDPMKGPMVVSYEPPDGMTGAESGTMLDERVDARDLSAGIISLAVKGYLAIEPVEQGLIFKKKSAHLHLLNPDTKLPLDPFEGQLYSLLRQCSSPIDNEELSKHVAPSINALRSSLYQSLVNRGYYRSSPESARQTFAIVGLMLVVGLAIGLTILSPLRNPLPGIVGGIVSAVIVGVFSRSMPRRTPQGAKALDRLRGFEEFIRRARKDEIEFLLKDQPPSKVFEDYLPHAIAFGVAAQWSHAFEGMLHEMPSWYRVPYGTPFHYGYFGHDLVTMTDSLSSAAATPPRSSGASGGNSGFSSGGGFSGGGFGGGGGSSW